MMPATKRALKKTLIVAGILLPSLFAGLFIYRFFYKEHVIYEMAVEDDGDYYKVAVTCRPDTAFSYYMYVVATRSGIEVGRSAMPVKGLDLLVECTEGYAVRRMNLEERNTKARIQFKDGEVMEVPVSFMHYPPEK